MRAALLVPLVLVSACAGITPKDLESMSAADVCYLGVTDSDKRAMAAAEIQRRGANCNEYEAEIKRREAERQAGMIQGSGAQRPSGMGMGGGMGRY